MPVYGHICFWRNKRIEVYASTSYAAQQEAAKRLGAKKPYEVTVILAEQDGVQVTHSTTEV